MRKLKGDALPKIRVERTERVLDTLERAVTSDDETDEVNVHSENDDVERNGLQSLPEHLRDPFAVIERGDFFLQHGIPSKHRKAEGGAYDDQLRMAARNGNAIPESVRVVMNADRAAVRPYPEHKSFVPESAGIVNPRNSMPDTEGDPVDRSIRETEIEDLAEDVSNDYVREGRIEPKLIADAEDLSYSFGRYGQCFDGLLECRADQFHVYINLDTNRTSDSPRARFSFAHELGHYLLDWHRCSLARGVPAHGSLADFQSTTLVEREADQFAANLLLPAKRIRKLAKARVDAAEIVRLANLFGTSLSATAMRCARLSLSPLIVMRWTQQGRSWCWSSNEFEERTGNKAFRSIERIPVDSVTRQMLGAQKSEGSVATRGTTLATWFPFVRAGSMSDDILVEECVPLGVYGALTVLRPA